MHVQVITLYFTFYILNIYKYSNIQVISYRRYKLEAEITSMTWKVSWEDIIDLQESPSRRDSLASSTKRGSQVVDIFFF